MDCETGFQIAAVCVALAGAAMDLKTHKIPNKLTAPCILVGLLLRTITGGISGLGTALTGTAMGSLFIFLWLLGGLKAGDVKLYMAVGALGGWRYCLNTEVYSILFGGAGAVIHMLIRENGIRSLKRVWLYMMNMLMSRSFYMYEGEESSYFCFGCFIAAGALAAALWQIL